MHDHPLHCTEADETSNARQDREGQASRSKEDRAKKGKPMIEEEVENSDPVGPSDPLALFHGLAVQAGLIAPAGTITPQMLAFASLIVDRCAAIADAYGDEYSGGNAGEHIRAELYDWPTAASQAR